MFLSKHDTESRLNMAQQTKLKLEDILRQDVHSAVSTYSNAIGVPPEYLFFPFMCVSAAMLGSNTRVEVTSEWNEPVILWTAVVAPKGTKKSVACQKIVQPFLQIIKESQQEFVGNQSLPNLLTDLSHVDEVRTLTEQGSQQVFAMCDSLGPFLASFYDSEKIKSTLLNSLYYGYPLYRNSTDLYDKVVEKTCFNLSGFIQPNDMIELINKDKALDFTDKILLTFPQDCMSKFESLIKSIDSRVPKIRSVLKVLQEEHEGSSEMVYAFTPEGRETFAQFHDEFVARKEAQGTSETRRTLFSKAVGQLARLSAIIAAIENAFTIVLSGNELHPDDWTTLIFPEHVRRGKALLDYTIKQRFNFLGYKEKPPVLPQPSQPLPIVTVPNPPPPPPLSITLVATPTPARYKLNMGFPSEAFPRPSTTPKYLANPSAASQYQVLPQGQTKSSTPGVPEGYEDKVRRLLEFRSQEITASEASQHRLFLPSLKDGKPVYPVENAKEIFFYAASIGLVEIFERQNDRNKRKSLVVRKRKLGELNDEQKDWLKRLKVDLKLYDPSLLSNHEQLSQKDWLKHFKIEPKQSTQDTHDHTTSNGHSTDDQTRTETMDTNQLQGNDLSLLDSSVNMQI